MSLAASQMPVLKPSDWPPVFHFHFKRQIITHLGWWVVLEVSSDWGVGALGSPNARPPTGKPTTLYYQTSHAHNFMAIRP